MSAALKIKTSQGKKSANNRILVVEDEIEIGKLYAEILSPTKSSVVPLRSSRQLKPSTEGPSGAASEFSVVVVQTPEAALTQVQLALQKNEPFAMGFFDVLLGASIDGIELVRQIHMLDPQLYAVFVTAYQDRSVDTIRKVLESSKPAHWDYLSKPFNAGEITQKARNFVSLWNLSHEREMHEELLEEANRRLLDSERSSSVAAVARGVSHEFGNLLMQIMGKADLGRKKSEKEMRDTLEIILQSSQRAAEILDRFKHLANPSQVKAAKTSVQLSALIDETIDLMEHSLRTHQIKVQKLEMENVEIQGNTTALLQVLVNLTINAIHAMSRGGQIDYSVKKQNDGTVELRVRDHGPGIPAELLEKVIEPFFTTKGEKGTGLGLAICREIIEIEHQGQFELRNHPERGLEVIMRLNGGLHAAKF